MRLVLQILQDAIQKAKKSAKLVPERRVITREGSMPFTTTVWVDPTKKNQVDQFGFDFEDEPEAKDQPTLVVNQHERPMVPAIRDEGAVAKRSQLFLRVAGSKDKVPVSSLKDASEKYAAVRDTRMRIGAGGSSTTPEVQVIDGEGKVVGVVSYNGRIWAPDDYGKNGAKPIYDTATDEEKRDAITAQIESAMEGKEPDLDALREYGFAAPYRQDGYMDSSTVRRAFYILGYDAKYVAAAMKADQFKSGGGSFDGMRQYIEATAASKKEKADKIKERARILTQARELAKTDQKIEMALYQYDLHEQGLKDAKARRKDHIASIPNDEQRKLIGGLSRNNIGLASARLAIRRHEAKMEEALETLKHMVRVRVRTSVAPKPAASPPPKPETPKPAPPVAPPAAQAEPAIKKKTWKEAQASGKWIKNSAGYIWHYTDDQGATMIYGTIEDSGGPKRRGNSRFETTDGEIFDTIQDAKKHEMEYSKKRLIMDGYVKDEAPDSLSLEKPAEQEKAKDGAYRIGSAPEILDAYARSKGLRKSRWGRLWTIG